MRTNQIFLGLCCLAAAIPAAAFELPPCALASRYELCDNDTAAKAGAALGRIAESIGEAIGSRLKILKGKLDQARAEVFSGHLSGPELQAAQLRLDELLKEKDYYLCLVDVLLAPGGRPAGSDSFGALAQERYRKFADFDDGIPKFARGAYIAWTDEVEAIGHAQGPTSSFPALIARYTAAMQQANNTYRPYAMARDWGEYAKAGRNVSEDPKEYLTTLIALKGPWWTAAAKNHPPSAELYNQLVSMFGQEAVSKVTHALMTAPKNHDGELAPPYRSDDFNYPDLMSALWVELSDTGARAYALEKFAVADHEYPNASLDEMRAAVTTYQTLAAAHGESALLRAAKIVHDAPKTLQGLLVDPRALGCDARTPKDAIEQLTAGPSRSAREGHRSTMQ
jgi:hypothetical protein